MLSYGAAHISTSHKVMLAVSCIVAVKSGLFCFPFLYEYSFGNTCVSSLHLEALEYGGGCCRWRNKLEKPAILLSVRDGHKAASGCLTGLSFLLKRHKEKVFTLKRNLLTEQFPHFLGKE